MGSVRDWRIGCSALVAVVAALACAGEPAAQEAGPSVRKPTEWSYTGPKSSKERVKAAHAAKDAVVKQLFAAAKVEFPPAAMLFRVYKNQKRFEVWATAKRGTAYTLVATYEVCFMSGLVGPKRKQGDMQVPEGFYTVDTVNPSSQFYLSLHVDYPNASDKVLSDRRHPGSAIMIHGNCVSAGCMAMSDERIQEIWVMTEAVRERKGPLQVHIFPSADWAGLLANPMFTSQRAFWQNLKEGHDLFEKGHIPPAYRVDRAGKYIFTNP